MSVSKKIFKNTTKNFTKKTTLSQTMRESMEDETNCLMLYILYAVFLISKKTLLIIYKRQKYRLKRPGTVELK